MDKTVKALEAIEILDSRSRPTLAVTLTLSDGTVARAGVPSGASTGTREAVELRDGDQGRYGGAGVLKAAAHVNTDIANVLVGRAFVNLGELDQALIDLDGSANKSRLGANAIVGVSIAAARAFAWSEGLQLWEFLRPANITATLPVPHFNVVNGGAHAQNALDFQEFMIAPLGAPSMAEALRAGSEIYTKLRGILSDEFSATGLGDEGGFAPPISQPERVLRLLVRAIEDAGYRADRTGVAIAMDPASSEFYRDGRYQVAGESLSSSDMITWYAELAGAFPVWLLEDGLAETDWEGWRELNARLGDKLELVGDDILCTNPVIIADAIKENIANAALIKVNQIGTVSETLEAMQMCRDAGWAQFVSHRSGETEDTFIADLAVASGCGHLKSGAPARGERTAKYNRLVEIEAMAPLRYGLSR
ncbi:MAG TPA: phosphopyruvate hydratase [Acidimicrobiales bacterium]|jgi:enolase